MSPSENGIFLIDTDVLAHIRFRTDSKAIYSALTKLAELGTLKTVHQVFGELKKHKVPYEELAPHEKHFVLSASFQFCEEVQEKLDLVGKHASYLWSKTGGKNPDPADPWLVAVASALGYTLVTNENPLSPAKIPSACKHPEIGAACISGAHFLVSAGIVTMVKPEHLSTSLFFGISTNETQTK